MTTHANQWILCGLLLAGCGGNQRPAGQEFPTFEPDQPEATPVAGETGKADEASETGERKAAASASASEGAASDSAVGDTETADAAAARDQPTPVPAEVDTRWQAQAVTATATLTLFASAESAGTVTFQQLGKEVTIEGTFEHLPPGEHALFIHERADCTGRGRRAGQHFNPTGARHGPPASAQRHAGDFGNLVVDDNGQARFEMVTDSITVLPGADSVVDHALIVHAGKDDGRTQPHGNAGPAIACGIIKRAGEVEISPTL